MQIAHFPTWNAQIGFDSVLWSEKLSKFSCKNGFLNQICIKTGNSSPIWYINRINVNCFVQISCQQKIFHKRKFLYSQLNLKEQPNFNLFQVVLLECYASSPVIFGWRSSSSSSWKRTWRQHRIWDWWKKCK